MSPKHALLLNETAAREQRVTAFAQMPDPSKDTALTAMLAILVDDSIRNDCPVRQVLGRQLFCYLGRVKKILYLEGINNFISFRNRRVRFRGNLQIRTAFRNVVKKHLKSEQAFQSSDYFD